MVENKTWIGIGTIAILLILASIGYKITDKTFFCPEKGIVMECARFSTSGNRCYPNLLDNNGYKDCSKWTKLKAEEINNILDEKNTIQENKGSSINVVKYSCNQERCIKL